VNLKLSPVANRPESQTPVSETMSWFVESVFDHVTTVPCATAAGFGTKPPVPRVRALVGMLIAAVEPDGDGDGAGDGAGDGEGAGDGVGDGLDGDGLDEYPLPQPVTNMTTRRSTDARRIGMAVMNPPNMAGSTVAAATGLPRSGRRNARYLLQYRDVTFRNSNGIAVDVNGSAIRPLEQKFVT
jgi:hypothetical protein